jgi:hypothetical protein
VEVIVAGEVLEVEVSEVGVGVVEVVAGFGAKMIEVEPI